MYKTNNVMRQIFNELTEKNVAIFITLLKTLYNNSEYNDISELKSVLHGIQNQLQNMVQVQPYKKYKASKTPIEYDLLLGDLSEDLVEKNRLPNTIKILDALKHVRNITNIEVFTYQDMCPACWPVWSKYIEIVKNLNIFDKNFSIDVYSIAPYDFKNHSFYQVQQNLHYSKWYKNKDFNYYPRRNYYNQYEQNSQYHIKQYIDRDGSNTYKIIRNNNFYNMCAKYYITKNTDLISYLKLGLFHKYKNKFIKKNSIDKNYINDICNIYPNIKGTKEYFMKYVVQFVKARKKLFEDYHNNINNIIPQICMYKQTMKELELFFMNDTFFIESIENCNTLSDAIYKAKQVYENMYL